MASTPPDDNNQLPIIWLTAPDALSRSSHLSTIQALPTAISATLAVFIILVLTILYHRSPNDVNVTGPEHNINLATVRNNIRIVRPESGQPPRKTPPTPFHHRPATTTTDLVSNLETRNAPATDDASTLPPSQATTPVQDYHSYLRDSIHGPGTADGANPGGRSPRDRNSYTVPLGSVDSESKRQHNGVKDRWVKTLDAPLVFTAASSDYSVSVDPTPRPSRQSSFRGGKNDGAWTRL